MTTPTPELRDHLNRVYRFRNEIANARQHALLWHDATDAAPVMVGSLALERIRAAMDTATAMAHALRATVCAAKSTLPAPNAYDYESTAHSLATAKITAERADQDVAEIAALYEQTRARYAEGE